MTHVKSYNWANVFSFEQLNTQMRALFETLKLMQPVSVFTFYQDNVAASQSGVVLGAGLGAISEHIMPYTGHIIAASIYSNEARTAGQLNVSPTIDGTALADALQLDATDTDEDMIEIERNLASVFLSGQRIGAKITTDGSWAPTTADIIVSIMVQFDMGHHHG